MALLIGWGLVGVSAAIGAPIPLVATSNKGIELEKSQVQLSGRAVPVWMCDGKSGPLSFKSASPVGMPPGSSRYLSIDYVDRGYGKLNVHIITPGHQPIRPDRFLGLSRTDSGMLVTARMRMTGEPVADAGDWSVAIRIDQPGGEPLAIHAVTLQETPFDDPDFRFVISDPWQGPYQGARVKPKDNSTLKGKVMVGYQGWFRTPNDPEGRGWVHWGDMSEGSFLTDMWPDTSQYPKSVLEKAADVKLKSGKQAYLFSSAWPGVVDTHFRWMREHDIDGAFLQRFVSPRFHVISGAPEWVVANVRAAASREGRIWAVEYDVSGCQDAKLLELMKKDWQWFVDEFRVLDDPNYAREGGKPVVFIWGLPFADRKISLETANSVVDFFSNDPKYGGNHVIGGIPSTWRKMDAGWLAHFKKYASVLTWMPSSYADDISDFRNLGISYYPHVKPGFSWANLKHLPTGDDSLAYAPRQGGGLYWKQLTDAARAGADRLFVGMFDEYDEGTAIMPMSDDSPPTPVRPGVGATFSNGVIPSENGAFVLLPAVDLALGGERPCQSINADNYLVQMSGCVVFPAAGDYKFSVEGAPGDDVELFLNGKRVLRANHLKMPVTTANPVFTVNPGDSVAFRLQCIHRTGNGRLRLRWETPGMPAQAVPPGALRDAWGRFLTNEGKSPDWWLQLTKMGKELITGKRDVSGLSPCTPSQTAN